MEYTIYCLACGDHLSQGGTIDADMLTAADVLSYIQHNPGCDLSHQQRNAPSIRKKREGSVVIYTITPGRWKDAEMIVE